MELLEGRTRFGDSIEHHFDVTALRLLAGECDAGDSCSVRTPIEELVADLGCAANGGKLLSAGEGGLSSENSTLSGY